MARVIFNDYGDSSKTNNDKLSFLRRWIEPNWRVSKIRFCTPFFYERKPPRMMAERDEGIINTRINNTYTRIRYDRNFYIFTHENALLC